MTASCVSFVSNVLQSVPDESAPRDFRDYHMMRQPGTVLVVDDLDDTRDLVTELLTRAGYTVLAAADGAEALAAIERALPDLVLSDVMMPNINGFELCRRLKADATTRLIPVVLVTALNERQDRLEGITAGADDFLTKPFDSTEL